MRIKSSCINIFANIRLNAKSIWLDRKGNVGFSLILLIKTFRLVYLFFAIYYVLISMRSTFLKYKEGRTVISTSMEDYTEYIYPSITFCTKFENGQKAVLAAYDNEMVDRKKQSGK